MANKTLQNGMYVRCPADHESQWDPRVFVCGQIVDADQESRIAKVIVHDPFGFCQ